jgi:hypothetical protein
MTEYIKIMVLFFFELAAIDPEKFGFLSLKFLFASEIRDPAFS